MSRAAKGQVMHYLADDHGAPCGVAPGSAGADFTEDWSEVTCRKCRAATSPKALAIPRQLVRA